MRSATAETIFTAEGYTVKSAGTEVSATVPLSNELILWADLIFVMEEGHKVIITNYFEASTADKKIIVLDIPDNFYYMEQELVELLKVRVAPHLKLQNF
jgi:protein-tyrosine phosphatase